MTYYDEQVKTIEHQKQQIDYLTKQLEESHQASGLELRSAIFWGAVVSTASFLMRGIKTHFSPLMLVGILLIFVISYFLSLFLTGLEINLTQKKYATSIWVVRASLFVGFIILTIIGIFSTR